MIEGLLSKLAGQGRTLAVAESLTGGMLADQIVGVPGASAVFRGGVVAYVNEVKASVLGVSRRLLADNGAVDPEVAGAMATGVVKLLGADIGIATTGVAGPEPADGQEPGTVFIAVEVAPTGVELVRGLKLVGDRQSIRSQTAAAAFALLSEALAEETS